MSHEQFFKTWRSMQGASTGKALSVIDNATAKDVISSLKHRPVSGSGFLSLLSPAADEVIERIEDEARELTAQRFGKIMNLYIPLYLSSSCINNCLYCGFRKDETFERVTLTDGQIREEGLRLHAEGYRNVLLVAGEDRREISVDYLENAIRILKEVGFVFVSIEVEPLTIEEYRRLGGAGLDGVTVYQETYDRDLYEKLHPTGPKKDFIKRLEAPERVAIAGIRYVGVGFLLGLGDWRKEALALAAHIRYLNKNFWQISVSASFPRLKEAPGNFLADKSKPVSDAELTRLILATRLLFPDTTLVLSTREPADLRDRLFGAGINQASAGSKTTPGAYTTKIMAEDATGEQFPVVDNRTPKEVMEAIRERGLEWVLKDWDTNLRPVT